MGYAGYFNCHLEVSIFTESPRWFWPQPRVIKFNKQAGRANLFGDSRNAAFAGIHEKKSSPLNVTRRFGPAAAYFFKLLSIVVGKSQIRHQSAQSCHAAGARNGYSSRFTDLRLRPGERLGSHSPFIGQMLPNSYRSSGAWTIDLPLPVAQNHQGEGNLVLFCLP